MPAPPRSPGSRSAQERPWAQTSFLDQVAGGTGEGNAPREVEDALGIADRAVDTASRRDALDRLYDYLVQRAIRHGRKPVPKRSDSRGTP